MKKTIIALALAAALSLALAGCMEEAGKDVSQTVSRIESGMEDAGSRLESDAKDTASRLESDAEDTGSRVNSAVDSMLEESSSHKDATPSPEPKLEPR